MTTAEEKDSAETGDEQPQYTVLVHDTPKFDLKSYINGYKGRTKFRRLHLIASCSTTLKEEAALMALAEAKRSSDINNYNLAITLLQSTSKAKDIDSLVDPNWVEAQENKNAAETKRMENELKQYKNNLIRESIRMGSEDLGQHYHSIGDLPNAVKAFSRMRDACTTPAHMASTAFRIISVAIEQRNWLAVQSQVHKVRNLQMRTEEAGRLEAKTNAAMGLQQMSSGDYKEAAIRFLATDASLADSYNEVLTSNDVAVYGGLCALASMTRFELQTQVLENTNFRNFLELEPHIRRAIAHFCARKYGQCLEILESYRSDYLLDIYLQTHVDKIFKRIRTKSIVQYFEPFSRVKLSSMEKMFGNPGSAVDLDAAGYQVSPEFRDELVGLIQSDLLKARLNLVNMTMAAKESNPRLEAQQAALDTVTQFNREAYLHLTRMNCINAGIFAKPDPKDKKNAAGGPMDLAGILDTNGPPGLTSGDNFQGFGHTLGGTNNGGQ